MKSPITILISAILLLTSCASIHALTLDESIRISQSENPAYKSSLLERALDDPSYRAAWGQFLPRISLGYGFNQSSFYNPTYLNPDGTVATYPRQQELSATSIDPATGFLRIDSLYTVTVDIPEGDRRGSSLFLRLDETLFDGGRNWLTLKNSLLSRDLRESNLSSQGFKLRRDVIHAYSDLVAAERLHLLSATLSEQRRLQLEVAIIRFETGSVTRRDVMQAEIDLGRSINDSLNSALELRARFEGLNRILNFPIDTTYAVNALPDPSPIDDDVDQLTNIARETRSDLQAAQQTVKLRLNEFSISQSDYYPSLNANLTHSRSEQSGINVDYTLSPRNRYTEIGLSANWVLFDRFSRSVRTQEASIRRKQAEISADQMQVTILQEVRSAYESLSSLYQQAVVAVKNRELAEETLEFELERYRLGSASLLELGAAQLSLAQAASDQIRIEANYHKAIADLETAVEKELR
ncbi:TolC family protein [Calditrichota bacterium]